MWGSCSRDTAAVNCSLERAIEKQARSDGDPAFRRITVGLEAFNRLGRLKNLDRRFQEAAQQIAAARMQNDQAVRLAMLVQAAEHRRDPAHFLEFRDQGRADGEIIGKEQPVSQRRTGGFSRVSFRCSNQPKHLE